MIYVLYTIYFKKHNSIYLYITHKTMCYIYIYTHIYINIRSKMPDRKWWFPCKSVKPSCCVNEGQFASEQDYPPFKFIFSTCQMLVAVCFELFRVWAAFPMKCQQPSALEISLSAVAHPPLRGTADARCAPSEGFTEGRRSHGIWSRVWKCPLFLVASCY